MALSFAEAERSFRRTRGNLDPRDGNIQKKLARWLSSGQPVGGVIHLPAIVQSEESAKPGPSGSLTRGASLQAPPPRFLISRQVGRTVRVAAISACFFRRIGRAKCLETLDCGILMGRTDLLFCPRGKPRKAMAGLNTTGAVSLRVRIRLNPSQNVAFVLFRKRPGG